MEEQEEEMRRDIVDGVLSGLLFALVVLLFFVVLITGVVVRDR